MVAFETPRSDATFCMTSSAASPTAGELRSWPVAGGASAQSLGSPMTAIRGSTANLRSNRQSCPLLNQPSLVSKTLQPASSLMRQSSTGLYPSRPHIRRSPEPKYGH